MAGYYDNSCGDDVPVHACDPCAPREFGRIGSSGWIHKDYYPTIAADPTNAALWIAGQISGQVIILPETRGSMTPTPVMGPGYGRQKEKLINFDYEANIFDPNYSDNCDHYNGLMLSPNYHFVYVTSSKLHITQVPVTVIPAPPIADDVTSEVVWDIKARWTYNLHPCPTDIPDGVFAECYIADPA